MAIGSEILASGEPTAPARTLVVSRVRTARRILLDRWASRLVVVGGIVIIAAILAILFVIAAEVAPLWRSPSATLLGTVRAPGPAPAPASGEGAGVDEYRGIAYAVTAAGRVELAALDGKAAVAPIDVPALGGATVSAVAAAAK